LEGCQGGSELGEDAPQFERGGCHGLLGHGPPGH